MAVTPEQMHSRRPFVIGWDMGFYDMVPDADYPAEVHCGWKAAQERAVNKKRADRYVKKWLQLRLGAFRRGKEFASDVTPAYLRAIDVTHCPILLKPMTHGKKISDLNWSIDRIDNRRGYERGNLAVISTYANSIKSNLSYEDVERNEVSGPLGGQLERGHWERM